MKKKKGSEAIMQETPLLSVCLITYNHAAFIRQAINGVLTQKVDFPWEFIIADDCSTDGTREILLEYKQKFPNFIKLILQERNKGAANNWKDLITSPEGKYIAYFEGDDYWCNEKKLQKQVDFLEANSEYAICCHRIYIKKGKQKPRLNTDQYVSSTEATYDIEMMAKHGNLVATPSVVYRNKLFPALPGWFDQSPVGDYVLNMINAQYGKIKYLPDAMAVYRDHSLGAWGGQTVKANASNMMKVIGLLLTEPFDEPVKNGLREQLKNIKAVYLNELMQEDWNLFSTEFYSMMDEDSTVAMALIEKMKMDMDEFRQSRTYKAIQKIRGWQLFNIIQNR